MPGNQYWERLKGPLVHGPLQALLAAVINISIFNLCNVAIECRADIRLPDQRQDNAQCRRYEHMHDACMVLYGDLVPRFLVHKRAREMAGNVGWGNVTGQ